MGRDGKCEKIGCGDKRAMRALESALCRGERVMKVSCRSVFEPMRRDEQDWGTEEGTGFERREICGNRYHHTTA